MDLLKEFNNNWNSQQFGKTQKSVLLACSGGSDSMVLAHLFYQSRIDFSIAHCNFQLRGSEANQDETFVREFAMNNKIPFFCTSFNTLQIASAQKKGIQETARILRYEWLEKIRTENNFGFIATAHHANDNVETLLINLFKGTGIGGLHGIRTMYGSIIRPLLFATKKDIDDYVKKYSICYREDSSNSSDKYLRNDVRLNIIPVIEKVFPNSIQQVNESIQRFSQTEIIFRKEIEKKIKKLTQNRNEDVYIPVLKILKSDVKETLIYELFSRFGFNSSQVNSILLLATAESGKFIENEEYKIIKDRNFLIVTKKKEASSQFFLVEQFPSTIKTPEGKFSITISTDTKIENNLNIAFINNDIIELPLILRRWRLGDYFYPLGMGMKKKKLSRFFIDQKMPLHEKEKIWVLESNKKIVWVSGFRLDERFKIKPSTTQVLKIVFQPN